VLPNEIPSFHVKQELQPEGNCSAMTPSHIRLFWLFRPETHPAPQHWALPKQDKAMRRLGYPTLATPQLEAERWSLIRSLVFAFQPKSRSQKTAARQITQQQTRQ
jgi:hypothetical protein